LIGIGWELPLIALLVLLVVVLSKSARKMRH
jgi:hypothetical protein